MHRERCQKLLEHLRSIPDERFIYDEYMRVQGRPVDLDMHLNEPECNTAACVAGHCCLLFKEDYKSHISISGLYAVPATFARIWLELNVVEADRLFFEGMLWATRQHAIARLEYLLEKDTLLGYNFDGEV